MSNRPPVEPTKGYTDEPHLDTNWQESSEIALVIPLKVREPPPLHEHDIIYDQEHNQTQGDHPQFRHHSGHFRHKAAEVWDPHPHYEVDAFGQKLYLELTHDYKFVAPTLQVTHVSKNVSQRMPHDPKMAACFYSGKVRGEINSDVAVSLCNGMTGYIRTAEGNYYIEPVKNSQDNNFSNSFLHKIKKLGPGEMAYYDGGENCATNDVSMLFDDDIVPSATEESIDKPEHEIMKREVEYDYLETIEIMENQTEFILNSHRTTREVPGTTRRNYYEYETRHKTTDNQQYHVEIMVVADRKMYEYHKTDDQLIHYILTLMSHVALLYKDATIGNPISLAVVKIWILKNDDFTSNSSQVMLAKFCDWQRKQNHDYPHDVALLLTRDLICKNPTLCKTLGVAEVGSMCSQSSCAIVRDKGPSASFTIAHELGHVFSMPHDDDKRCTKYRGDDEINKIMSREYVKGSQPWIWSACSKHFLTEFLESRRAKCLLDRPSQDLVTSNFFNILPGEVFEVDKQCEMEYGRGHKVCSYMPFCRSLWCSSDVGQLEICKTLYMPWADGTSCGHKSWCHHGECVALDRELLKPIAGGWGPWQAWEPCTRTCGGGVKMSRRACDSPRPANGGMYCTGRSVRYVSCNTQPCEPDAVDFRELQCAEHNGQTKGIPGLTSDVKWVPKYGKQNPDDYCRLYCRVQHTNQDYLLKDKVIDGTKCGLTSFDICVNGICRPGGCDNNLESKVELDECGVCGGDNSTCEEITGSFNSSIYGYNRVVKIPKGSLNIHVYQRGYGNSNRDDNYLALVDGETGEYILNGNLSVSNLKDIVFGGLTIRYSGSGSVIEEISTPKLRKLKKDLFVEVLSVGKVLPPDITYRYTISRDIAPKFVWRFYNKQWSACNSICSGTQFMRPDCVNLTSGLPILDSYCSEFEQNLVQTKECNTHCQLMWNAVTRGKCSTHCGKGVRTVSYNCIKFDIIEDARNPSGNAREIVDDHYCNVLPRPAELESCQGPCDATRWEYTEWSECSKTCGGGIRTRSAKCVDDQHQPIDSSHCNEDEKVIEQICNTKKCPTWSQGDWSSCSVTCGKGYRTKQYFCHVQGKIYRPSACNPADRPDVRQECMERPCAWWTTGIWGTCSTTCGEGIQRRDVVCITVHSTEVDEEHCKDFLKPNNTRICVKEKCPEIGSFTKNDVDSDFEYNVISASQRYRYRWISGKWTKCSKSCGGGYMFRMVVCRNELGQEHEYMCDQSEKPVDQIECNPDPCPKWNYGAWSKCDDNCEQHRQVSCQNHKGDIVDDSQCDPNIKPYRTAKCNNEKCLISFKRPNFNDVSKRRHNAVQQRNMPYKWKVGRWGPCSESCGKGKRTRLVSCRDIIKDVTVVDQFCPQHKKPKAVRNCEAHKCDYTWVEGPWSQCSQTCGEGVKERTVTCHRVLPGGFTDMNPLLENLSGKIYYKPYCDIYKKPPTRAKCIERNCYDSYSWVAGPWNECTQPCGKKGRQTRILHCVSKEGKKVNRKLCSRNLKPHRKRKCNQKRCLFKSCKEVKYGLKTSLNKDYQLLIHEKPAMVYCYKMDTREPEEYISLMRDRSNFAEFYDKRLIDIETCPNNGQRRDNCECMTIGPERSGFTIFWKVRLNITSLQIITNDFTFSHQTKGRQIEYGTAGDCYSAYEGCPQGRFSVDLTDTSFRLSKSIRWIESGHHSSMQIAITDYSASGKCGGYCGQCLLEPSIGLAVEVT